MFSAASRQRGDHKEGAAVKCPNANYQPAISCLCRRGQSYRASEGLPHTKEIGAIIESLRDLPSNHSEDLPGAPVTVQGFLVHRVKQGSDGSGESTNCHLLNPDEVDWHIYLSDTAALDDISQAIIVETTPRKRQVSIET